eukprot:m.131495 g.131495  ORF g.131495 m.131495 type:complete len:128 (+) comp13756_c0_seq1:1086-1469(+)
MSRRWGSRGTHSPVPTPTATLSAPLPPEPLLACHFCRASPSNAAENNLSPSTAHVGQEPSQAVEFGPTQHLLEKLGRQLFHRGDDVPNPDPPQKRFLSSSTDNKHPLLHTVPQTLGLAPPMPSLPAL